MYEVPLLPNMFWLSRIGGGWRERGGERGGGRWRERKGRRERGEVKGEGGGSSDTALRYMYMCTSCAGNSFILLQVKLMDGYFKF